MIFSIQPFSSIFHWIRNFMAPSFCFNDSPKSHIVPSPSPTHPLWWPQDWGAMISSVWSYIFLATKSQLTNLPICFFMRRCPWPIGNEVLVPKTYRLTWCFSWAERHQTLGSGDRMGQRLDHGTTWAITEFSDFSMISWWLFLSKYSKPQKNMIPVRFYQ